jgi:hypothetical protein
VTQSLELLNLFSLKYSDFVIPDYAKNSIPRRYEYVLQEAYTCILITYFTYNSLGTVSKIKVISFCKNLANNFSQKVYGWVVGGRRGRADQREGSSIDRKTIQDFGVEDIEIEVQANINVIGQISCQQIP